ncbi:hypothetical protein IGI04_033959 [Brassica rapa subsp. trilocularis]|uniref:CCHC-type domain-containing protein n=1 Tax=Brassica rapa subsp. trilocularis TaxID=1813537 RepID=A0ABQ7L7B7_BRACM|nr:hypothetical protein IGI04_033959 [Brassica rapa subsp. trilocularis]
MSSSQVNPWFPERGCDSGLNPGEFPVHPPDPPDPPDPDFPPLPSSPATITSQTASSMKMKTASTASSQDPSIKISVNLKQITSSDSAISKSGSEKITAQPTVQNSPRFTIHLPKPSSPLRSNPASSAPPSSPIPPTPSLPVSNPNSLLPGSTPESVAENSQPPQTYAQKARNTVDRSLKRLAPTSTSADGKPQVVVPDVVFQRGAELHKEYLVGTFLGKMPDYGPIQSVLNYMWGKGVKLEIHLQPQKRSFLVRIANEFIRSKVLEKQLWYVGTSMFFVSQWGSPNSSVIPEIESIPLWAYLSGVPFDLRTKEGLSLAAGLVGEPIETDDYTKNLTDLNVAHVKVEADLTKPLPSSGELVRQNGEIILISIEYPWTPPSCTHCSRIGHIKNDCIYAPVNDTRKGTSKASQVGVPDPPYDDEAPDHSTSVIIPADNITEPTILADSPDDLEMENVPEISYPITTGVPDPPDDDMNLIEEGEITAEPPLEPTHSLNPLPPFVFGLAATYAPTFGSFITTQQAAAFNAPAITLPPQFCVPSRPPLTFSSSSQKANHQNHFLPSFDPATAPKEPPPGGTPPPCL